MRPLLLLLLLLAATPAGAVGFQRAEIPDPAGGTLELALWYPSDAPATPRRLGPYTQTVAVDGALRGERLPLVLISHGAGGNLAGHHDTAIALAEAGFIAAALTHRGDSTEDQSLSGTARGLANRPRQYHVVMDWLLTTWPGRAAVDPGRIGGFGYSAGGFTVLVAAGGEPNLARIPLHCALQPADPSCRFGRPEPAPAAPLEWVHEPRLRAIVVAAPGPGHVFVPNGLASVTMPVQLWNGRFDEVLLHPWHAEQVRYALPNPPLHAEVQLAGHYAFLAPCPPAMLAAVPEICIDPPGLDRADFHREFNAAVVSFFRSQMQ